MGACYNPTTHPNTEKHVTIDLDKLASLCKRRGFIFQSSEIYGGLASTWDYGPLGAELKRNVKDSWWRSMVLERDDMVGLDSAIIMHPEVWKASGHVESFTDPLVECVVCHRRWREDQLPSVVPAEAGTHSPAPDPPVVPAEAGTHSPGASPTVVPAEAGTHSPGAGPSLVPAEAGTHSPGTSPTVVPAEAGTHSPTPDPVCPECEGKLTPPRMFNLMFETHMGPVRSDENTVHLRPETAQGIFVNFANVVTATRRRPPFGIAQIGKAFRNEITTGNFIYRTREFEMMEIEFFVPPGEDEEWHERWIEESVRWYASLGVDESRLRIRPHDPDELSHYSKATSDIEYRFPWGWGEIQGTANRTDYDLRAHAAASGESLSYFDDALGDHVVPYVIEPSFGVDRAMMTFLVEAYVEEEAVSAKGKPEKRVVLKLHPALAPVKVAVLPLSRNERLTPTAREVYDIVRRSGAAGGLVQFDDAQSIGRRYRRQDEIGTPLCVTVDFDTLDDQAVTIRDRDTMQQQRVAVSGLVEQLRGRFAG